MTHIGASRLRKEDDPLLRGTGKFAADVHLPEMLHAMVVRSPHAHAAIRNISLSRALSAPGVVATLTARDLPADLAPIPLRLTDYEGLSQCLQHVLARDRVRYVGEPVAVVVASNRYTAEDAAELVDVDYEVLPAVASIGAALAAGAAQLHDGIQGNVMCRFEQRVGDIQKAEAECDLVIAESFATGRASAVPIECRGLVADYDQKTQRLTMWGETKVVHFNRAVLASMLRIPESRIHFMTTDVGGGFGARGELYPEDFCIPYLALRLGRPVAWVEDRQEHLNSINHSRQQEHRVRAMVRSDGVILGLHVQLDNDQGAYVRTHGATVPEIGSALLRGPYRIPNFLAEVRCVATNKTPTGTYRGPGRYEGTFVRERVVDLVAHRLKLDPAEVRRRNFITPDEMPYELGTFGLGEMVRYDSGDYPALLRAALAAIDYDGWRRRQAERRQTARQEDRRLGIGIAAFVEKSGLGPWEYARAELDPAGRTVIYSGGSSMGQGMLTVLAQIAADGIGVDPDQIDVVYGDTDRVPRGVGGFASRVTTVGGAAALGAATELRRKVLEASSAILEASADDLELVAGEVRVRGVPHRKISLAEVASHAGVTELVAENVYHPSHMSYPAGVHAAIVEVDIETGGVEILDYAIAYDVGRAINPVLVRGQLQGGLGQGVGGALLEELVYTEDGQPRSSTFVDYLLPTAAETPAARIELLENPSPVNPMGAKGAGEGGCTGAGGCVANAIADALTDLGVEPLTLPVSPSVLRNLVRVAAGAES